MRRRARGVIAIGVCCAVLASACTDDGPPEEEAGVLGIQVERDGSEVATVVPTETAPASPSPGPSPEPPPAGSPTDEATDEAPVVSGDPAPGDDGTAAPPPVPPAPPPDGPPSPSPAPSPSPEPEALESREGHSYVTWFRDEEDDGEGGTRYVWSEVSAAPVVTREGSEPLRVSLIDLAGEEDRSAPRRAQCPAWLEVDGDRAIVARGTLTVEVLVDGEAVSSGVRDIAVTVRPGERRDLVAIGDDRVSVPEVAEVTCRVSFVRDANG
ncbi:MAG: hypothetical protein KY461_13515 [Actinobacteria bacterium]|nr:hypothetical protein [Actinomycetota bacterium]